MSTNHHDPHDVGDGLAAANFNAPLGQLDDAITKLANGTTPITPVLTALNASTDTTLTIASGAVTRSRIRHLVDTEGAAAADDLDTINGGTEGDWLVLSVANAARVVTLRHGTGNLQLAGALDLSLTATSATILLQYDGTTWNEVGRPQSAAASVCEGRLTLTSGAPVTTADVTGAATLFFTPFHGNRVALYTGTRWVEHAFSEISVSLAGLPDATNYDVFLVDFAGTLTLVPIAWTDGTTRATALALQDGVYVKSDAPIARYVGTIRMSGVGTCEDSLAKRFVWNAQHRRARPMSVVETTDSWNYTTATWRAANNSTANRLQFVQGLIEDTVEAVVSASCLNSGGAIYVAVGVGVDATNANSAQIFGSRPTTAQTFMTAFYRGLMSAAGYHYLQWLEISTATGTTTWFGDGGSAMVTNGIVGEVMA